MKILLRTFLCASIVFATSATAEVTDAEAGGFTTVNEVMIDANAETAWRAAIDGVGKWWNPDHTISGDASRMSITAAPQGCFCENFGGDAGVVHMNVSMVSPGALIRLTGALGPLGLMGVSGNMTWEFETVEDATKVRFTYAVGGYRPGGLDVISGPVDAVIGEALARLKAQIETGDPENADLG